MARSRQADAPTSNTASSAPIAVAKHRAMVRFFLGFLLLQAVLFGAELTPWAQRWFVLPWTDSLAAISADLVKLFDPGVIAEGKGLQSANNDFAVSIEAGCNGVEAT